MGLSPHYFWGGCGFEFTSLFFGGGVFFLNFVLFGWWWWFYFDFLGDYFFKRIFFYFIFFVLCWKCIYICLTFTQSLTQFFVLWGSVSVGRCAFCVIGASFAVINCFWKIRVALKRAGFGATCAG